MANIEIESLKDLISYRLKCLQIDTSLSEVSFCVEEKQQFAVLFCGDDNEVEVKGFFDLKALNSNLLCMGSFLTPIDFFVLTNRGFEIVHPSFSIKQDKGYIQVSQMTFSCDKGLKYVSMPELAEFQCGYEKYYRFCSCEEDLYESVFSERAPEVAHPTVEQKEEGTVIWRGKTYLFIIQSKSGNVTVDLILNGKCFDSEKHIMS